MTVQERVARGFNWLLNNRRAAIKDIDVHTLNVESISHCPLGQTGGYKVAYTEYDREWSYNNGFDAVRLLAAEYDELTAEWVKVLNAWNASE